MHGLTTIRQLNELAAHNAKGAPEEALRKADEVRAARGDKPFNERVDEYLAAQKAEKAAAAEQVQHVRTEEVAPYKTNLLATRSTKWLLDYVGGLENPTTLEVALAQKLEAVQKELEAVTKRLSVFID